MYCCVLVVRHFVWQCEGFSTESLTELKFHFSILYLFNFAGLDRHHTIACCCYEEILPSCLTEGAALGYHNSWDCWYFLLLYDFVYCTVLMWAVLTDGRWKLAATYFNTVRCHHCDVMLYTYPGISTPCSKPASSTTNITVTVDSTWLH